MTSSGAYSFNPDLISIITDAYERCGKEPSMISSYMIKSALYTSNMVLADLANQQLNLWTVESMILSLNDSQATYALPLGTIDVTEVTMRYTNRLLSGTAASSAGGTAANAFDGDSGTACTQTTPDGNISYDWGTGVSNLVNVVGIQSNSATTYTLIFEGSVDGSTWISKLVAPAKAYIAGQTQWYDIPYANKYQYFRVRETGGATLNVREVYFNALSGTSDIIMSRLSRSEYVSVGNKAEAGRSSSFYIERAQSIPTITFWPPPQEEFTSVFINRIRQVQDATQSQQTLDIPYRFLEAFTSTLAAKLALKCAFDRVAVLAEAAKGSVDIALMEDRERVDVSFKPDLGGYAT